MALGKYCVSLVQHARQDKHNPARTNTISERTIWTTAKFPTNAYSGGP